MRDALVVHGRGTIFGDCRLYAKVNRDERRAAIFLERRRHYGAKPRVKPRTTGLALSLLIACALVGMMLVRCSGRDIEITLSGELEQWSGKAIYDAQQGWILPASTPFRLTVRLPADTLDLDPDPLLGIYIGGTIEFSFGDIHERQHGAKVWVYSGKHGLWGIMLGNAHETESYGVYHEAEWSWYAFSLQPFSASVALTDALHWTVLGSGSFWHTLNKHCYMNGAGIHAESDEIITPYTARYLP